MKWTEIPEIDLYADGGSEPNPGKGGFGVILAYKGKSKEFYQGYTLTTNNRMELMGVIFGLEQLKTKSIVNVHTDSRYVVDGITKGWASIWKSNNWFKTKNQKAVNYDLWDRLLSLVAIHEVSFSWIKGHDGHPENERCDELATIAIESEEAEIDYQFEKLNGGLVKKTFDQKIKTEPITTQSKIQKEGDLCRKCDVPVEKKAPKRKKIKRGQEYYFEYYLLCPNCNTYYYIEEAKKIIINNELFK